MINVETNLRVVVSLTKKFKNIEQLVAHILNLNPKLRIIHYLKDQRHRITVSDFYWDNQKSFYIDDLVEKTEYDSVHEWNRYMTVDELRNYLAKNKAKRLVVIQELLNAWCEIKSVVFVDGNRITAKTQDQEIDFTDLCENTDDNTIQISPDIRVIWPY